MWSRAAERRPRLRTAAVLAAALLWLATDRGEGSESTGTARCDTGKLHLDRDLPEGGVYCQQPGSAGRLQTLQAVDKVYAPEPAAEICMDQTISYQRTLPHSGVFRPVGAESGEYLYCPPQRWLNNLHQGATVLLYHPCAAGGERRLLSSLARSCLPHHIISSHPQLGAPVALVSWGRTLELVTAASAEVCHWLEATSFTREKPGGASDGRKYNLLLTCSAEQQHRGSSEGCTAKTKESVRSCCERTLSEHRMRSQQQRHSGVRSRQRRASSREKTANAATTTSGAPGTRTQSLPRPPQSMAPPRDGTPSPRPAPSSPGSRVSRPAQPGPHSVPALTLELKNHSEDSSPKEVRQRERQSRSPAPPAAASGGTLPTSRAAQVQGGVKEVQGPAEETQGASGNLLQRPRTPRTDEAVWAAAALGFLLVLLALSVLHTRLYRHWRRAPSLYWQHPQDHYDSVADVIRRRLHLAKRRRRRSRRQEAVLLPSSSSSDELP